MNATSSAAPRAGRLPANKSSLVLGLILSIVIAGVSTLAAKIQWLQNSGFSALTIAIVLGMVIGNTVYGRLAPGCAVGVDFSKKNLLRLGIILYGFRLTFQDIGNVGMSGVVIDALVLTSTFGMAVLLGTKVFKLDRNTVLLIGAGSSICGAAAVMATEPVVKAHPAQVTVAVATVVVFGSLAIFLYPMLYRLNEQYHFLANSALAFGVYTGSTVHEVAQVVAAARAISPEAANTAVIAKMVRVMMLAPFLMLLSAYISRRPTAAAKDSTKESSGSAPINGGKAALAVPWFAFGFVAVVGLNSMAWVPMHVTAVITDFDSVLLAMAMAALGLTTHFSALRQAGVRPLLFAAVLFGWLIVGGAVINSVVMRVLG
ncbi:YeiH family putative sulfate export transporter [Glaciimonas sp. PCH181]|nr:YeiH family putative sulfate export transporter [Glaciimonas sp. PCH181]